LAGKLRPSDVFTPNAFPVEDHQAYAARTAAEADLERALSRSQVPVIYGEFGVGKTTLVKRFFLAEEQEGRFVHFLSPSGKNLDDLAKRALEQLRYTVEVSSEARTLRSAEAGIEIGLFATLKARLGGGGEREKTIRSELIVTTPTDQGFLEIMADHRMVFAIDEMHTASDGFRLQLAELIKATSNMGRGFPKIVILGTSLDASRLVARDEGIDRLIAEIEVPPMTDDEASSVVREGMKTLGIKIDTEHVESIVRTAAGAPALLQEISLDAAEAAESQGRELIQSEDIDRAIELFVTHGQWRLTVAYVSAVETTGTRQYRKLILHAMADSPHDFVTMDELRNRVGGYLGLSDFEQVPSSALSGPLRELKSPERGGILMDVDRPAGYGRIHNVTAFRDPRMKAFIRTMRRVEAQGLLPTRQELDALPPPGED
jgi:type II secretory pathway predicted ATPase ExeA